MRYPTNYISITQYPHPKNDQSIDFGWCSHRYQDIMSVDDGVVLRTETQKTGGNCIFIQHNTGIVSLYAHLDKMIVKKGQKVTLGQKIGTMGQTGTSATAMHLHFGLYSKAKADKGFNSNGLYGKADINPFDVLYVYPNQDASKVALAYQPKLKYYKGEEVWEKGNYRLLYIKSVRKSHNLGNNEFRVKELKKPPENWTKKELNMLVSQKDNDKAKLNKNSVLQIVEIYKEGSRIWGKYGAYGSDWVVLCNITGEPQAERV